MLPVMQKPDVVSVKQASKCRDVPGEISNKKAGNVCSKVGQYVVETFSACLVIERPVVSVK